MNQRVDTKEYEISFLVMNQEAEAVVVSLLNQYKVVIIEKGQLTAVRLSYPIKKHKEAFLGFITFRAIADSIVKIQQSLKLQPEVIRMLIITPPISRIHDNREQRFDGKVSKEKREKTDMNVSSSTQSNVLSNEALKEQLAVLEGESKK